MDGRKEHKAFLYDIISNNANGIDVDKWDYFARDCYYLGVKSSFDHLRLMNFARVLKVSEERQIAICHISYRDKEVLDVYGLFHTRNLLHQKAYQHKTVKAVECMLSDVILLMKDLLTFQGKDGVKKTLVNVMEDPMAYESLDDTVISRIKQMDPSGYSKEQEKTLTDAKDLIKRLEKREIYRCFRSAPIINAEKIKQDDSKHDAPVLGGNSPQSFRRMDSNEKKIEKLEGDFLERPEVLRLGLQKEDFAFDIVTYDYGMGAENPVDKVYFYEKSNLRIPKKIPKDQVSMMLPETFEESRLLVFLKNKELLSDKKKIGDFERKFKHFCNTSITLSSRRRRSSSI